MTLDQRPGSKSVDAEEFADWHRTMRSKDQMFGGEVDSNSIEGRLQAIGESVATFWGPVVILDFLLGLSLIGVNFQVAGGLPGGVVTGALMMLVGSMRRPQLRVKSGGLSMMLALAVLLFVVVETIHNGMPWTQRTLKLVILLGAAATLATGRINIRSLILGGCAGAVLNIPLFYAGLASNNYPPYLTGYYLDKNVAGMYYAIWGVLGILALSRRSAVVWVLLSGVAMYLTGSRTSLAALACAWAWVLLRNRVGVSYRLLYTLLGYGLLSYALNHWASNSVFGGRSGDDWYRGQIMKAMAAKVAETPWYGLGLNSGTVTLGDRTQWFHDSYQQAFVEGGYVLLSAFVLVFTLVGWGLLDRRLHISRELLICEASVVVVLVCAWKLGEAFMTMGAFLVLGMCIAYRLGTPSDSDPYDWTTHATRILGEESSSDDG